MRDEGWHPDARGYETAFRLTISLESADGRNLSFFEEHMLPRLAKQRLGSAINLGKVDIFPVISGKANAALHLLRRLDVPPEETAMLFDDENDLDLAKLCGRGFLPTVTHEQVRLHALEAPNWKVSASRGPLGTEEALEGVLQLLPAATI
mmetsp:Transcript_91366/g.295459  ORF Transcript_91366/g.295459 Transcript_91366/m.295459 type:complete len:150 (+) Transcript_91366:575-1024(+)